MNIMFIAPPAAGKGTLSNRLKEKYHFNHISAGEVLREEAKSGSELGLEIKKLIDNGELVDDSILKRLIKKKLSTIDLSKGIIMDGYPRKINQLYDYEDILKELGEELGFVFYLNLDKEELLKRALGRMNCPNCNKDYNVLSGFNTPKNEGMCDICNIPLVSRADDTEESFYKRYDNYVKETAPIVDLLKTKNKIIELNSISTDAAFEQIERYLNNDNN